MSLWTPQCYFFAIMHFFSQSLSIVLRCGCQLLNVTFSFSSSRCIRGPWLGSDQSFCRCVINVIFLGYVCCTRLIRTRITVCSASFHLLLPEFDKLELRRQLIHLSSKYQGVERPNYEGVSCRPMQVKMWNDLPYTGTQDGFNGAVNSWLPP